MNKMYITSQIVAFVAFILSLIAYHRKENLYKKCNIWRLSYEIS